VERDGKSLLEWIRTHSLRGWPGLAGPELGFSRTSTASVLRNDACFRLPARNTIIVNNYISAHLSPDATNLEIFTAHSGSSRSSRASFLIIPGLRDDAVEEYCKWHCSKVRSAVQRQHYKLACALILERGFDLQLVFEDRDAQYYIERGVIEGIARRWVQDVEVFLEQYSL
jgi:hypothetical protein